MCERVSNLIITRQPIWPILRRVVGIAMGVGWFGDVSFKETHTLWTMQDFLGKIIDLLQVRKTLLSSKDGRQFVVRFVLSNSPVGQKLIVQKPSINGQCENLLVGYPNRSYHLKWQSARARVLLAWQNIALKHALVAHLTDQLLQAWEKGIVL